MKNTIHKQITEGLPSLIKTIKGPHSQNHSQLYNTNFCEMKTRKLSFKSSIPLMPPLDLKRKISLNVKASTHSPDEEQSLNAKTERKNTSKRPSSYRISKVELPINSPKQSQKQTKLNFQGTEDKINDQSQVNFEQFQKINQEKLLTERKYRRYPQCKVIKSKNIPFDLTVNKSAVKKTGDFMEQVSIISQIEREDEPFISIQSFECLAF